jgi:hypothetical protein
LLHGLVFECIETLLWGGKRPEAFFKVRLVESHELLDVDD